MEWGEAIEKLGEITKERRKEMQYSVLPRCIAIDFDDTFTADPELWSRFIQHGKSRGHKFYCVTSRGESVENVDIINEWFDIWECQMPIVFANRASKVDTMECLGIKVDIWIDDAPYALVRGY